MTNPDAALPPSFLRAASEEKYSRPSGMDRGEEGGSVVVSEFVRDGRSGTVRMVEGGDVALTDLRPDPKGDR